MAKSDLEEFPDGGRATLTRRYSPALTKRQLVVLESCSTLGPVAGRDLRIARTLTSWGLLEHPEAGLFRSTNSGAEVVLLWKYAGFLP